MIGLFALGMLARRAVPPQTADQPSPIIAPLPAPARGAFNPGDSVILERPGGAGNTIFALDEASFDLLLGAKSVGEFSRLREQDKVRGVTNGTPAVVLESRPGRTRVRIADGPQLGTEGWVQEEFVHPWK